LTPLKKFLADYHVHPYYSLDAEGTVEEYCQQALSLGLSEIGLAPHLELDPHRKALNDKVRIGSKIVSMRSDWLSTFIEDVTNARRRYPLQIRVGIEVGYDECIEDDVKEVLTKYPFDFCRAD
jgi:Histidinol phosphatase and related hydrolases of the PHP family